MTKGGDTKGILDLARKDTTPLKLGSGYTSLEDSVETGTMPDPKSVQPVHELSEGDELFILDINGRDRPYITPLPPDQSNLLAVKISIEKIDEAKGEITFTPSGERYRSRINFFSSTTEEFDTEEKPIARIETEKGITLDEDHIPFRRIKIGPTSEDSFLTGVGFKSGNSYKLDFEKFAEFIPSTHLSTTLFSGAAQELKLADTFSKMKKLAEESTTTPTGETKNKLTFKGDSADVLGKIVKGTNDVAIKLGLADEPAPEPAVTAAVKSTAPASGTKAAVEPVTAPVPDIKPAAIKPAAVPASDTKATDTSESAAADASVAPVDDPVVTAAPPTATIIPAGDIWASIPKETADKTIYDIKEGDSVSKIAKQHLTDDYGIKHPSEEQIWNAVDHISAENGMNEASVNLIYSGGKLTIPPNLTDDAPQTLDRALVHKNAQELSAIGADNYARKHNISPGFEEKSDPAAMSKEFNGTVAYKLKQGDTLYDVAKGFKDTTWQDIARANGFEIKEGDLENPADVKAGEKLYVPVRETAVPAPAPTL